MFLCKFCGKPFNTGVSLGGHTTKCSKNPNNTDKIPWSDERRKQHSEIKNYKE